jgi:hypothetical protein
MAEHDRFNIEKILDVSVPIQVRELIDIALKVHQQFTNQIRSSESRRRRVPSTSSVHSINIEGAVEPIVMETAPEYNEIPECLYITSWVNGKPLPKMLVDSGVVVDLISPEIVEKIGAKLKSIKEKPWGIRVASDDLIQIREYVDLQVNVVEVEMPVTTYMTGIRVTYDLLLSRCWMEGVEAQEDYKSQKFTILHNEMRIEVQLMALSVLKERERGYDLGPGLKANVWD